MATIRLEDNVLNRTLGPAERKFKLWSSVGLMLSYYCPSRCACCYVFAGPDSLSAETEMSVALALDCWRAIRRLAGERGKVHITGGEPFSDYDRLRELLKQAHREGLEGLEKIETNAYWCTDEILVRERLAELKRWGLSKLQISTDVYHQEYVPIERVRLGCEVAEEVLGSDGVQVRWRDFLAASVQVAGQAPYAREELFRAALSRRRERLVGRAARELVGLFPSRNYTAFAETNCHSVILGSRHVHVDGAGNVFCGTCVGIIIDKVLPGQERSLDGIWRKFDYRTHPIFSRLAKEGPVGLLGLAEPLGYRHPDGYASKCHMCYEIRRFLYESGQYLEFLGPGVCYGRSGKVSHKDKTS